MYMVSCKTVKFKSKSLVLVNKKSVVFINPVQQFTLAKVHLGGFFF